MRPGALRFLGGCRCGGLGTRGWAHDPLDPDEPPKFIIAPAFLPLEWIQPTGGGHTAIARITTNRADDLTQKLYAIEGSEANDWLARVKAGMPQLDDPRLVHGIFTYDYFSIVRATGESGGV